MAYDVTIERTTECPTAVVKADTTWRELPTLWPTVLDEVWTFPRATPGVFRKGHNVMLYTNDVSEGEVAVEVGVQVTESFEAAGCVVLSTSPAADAATTVHLGTPVEIGAAHHAVRGMVLRARRELTGGSWEIYGNPDPQTGHFNVAMFLQLAESGDRPGS